MELPKQLNHRRPSGYLFGDNELTVKFSDEENRDDDKLNEELFSANHSYNDSNNNLCDLNNLNKLQIPTSSMDTLTQSNVSLNVPSPSSPSSGQAAATILSSSPQHHPSILLRTPELNVVQEGEIMQFALPSNHPTNYSINNQASIAPNFRLNSISANPQQSTTLHNRTSRCKMTMINNQVPDYCNCKNYRHSMFVGNGHLDYSTTTNKQFAAAPASHLHPDELYEDYSIPNAHTIDGLNMQASTFNGRCE